MNYLDGTVINGFNFNNIVMDAIYNTNSNMFNKTITIYTTNYSDTVLCETIYTITQFAETI